MFDKHTCYNFYGLPLSIDEEKRASFIECLCGNKALKNRKQNVYKCAECNKAFILSNGEFQVIKSENY